MFHVHAWGVPYVATMLGVKQVYPGRYEPEMLLRLLLTEKVTFSHCVPTILHMLVSSPVAKAVDLSNWKVVIGGAALPAGLAKAALNLGIDVITGYGMSETCPVLSITYLNEKEKEMPVEEQINIRTKTGVPIPLVEMKVIDYCPVKFCGRRAFVSKALRFFWIIPASGFYKVMLYEVAFVCFYLSTFEAILYCSHFEVRHFKP